MKSRSFKSLAGFTGIIGTILIIVVIIVGRSTFGEQFNEENVDKPVTISWSEVNVRSEPSTHSEIISSLSYGASVKLTGKAFECIDGPYASWCQIRLKNGKIGWVVRQAIQWKP